MLAGVAAGVSLVSVAVSSVAGGVGTVFASGVAGATLIARVARNAPGGTASGAGVAVRSAVASGVEAGAAGVVAGRVFAGRLAAWGHEGARLAVVVEESSCSCRKSVNLAEGSFGAGATAVADALFPDALAGRKPSDVLPEYAFMVS